MPMQLIEAFPTPICIVDSSDPDNVMSNRLLKEQILTDADSDHNGQDICRKNYTNGYTSFWTDQHLYKNENYRGVADYILRASREFIKSWGYTENLDELIMKNLWSNVQYLHSVHGTHNHRRSIISGVYYVDCGENPARLTCNDPTENFKNHMYSPNQETKFMQDILYINPRPGRLVMFPGWLMHGTEMHLDDKARISLSFNIDWRH